MNYEYSRAGDWELWESSEVASLSMQAYRALHVCAMVADMCDEEKGEKAFAWKQTQFFLRRIDVSPKLSKSRWGNSPRSVLKELEKAGFIKVISVTPRQGCEIQWNWTRV